MKQSIQKGVRLNKKADEFIKDRMNTLGITKFKTYFLWLLRNDGYRIDHEDV